MATNTSLTAELLGELAAEDDRYKLAELDEGELVEDGRCNRAPHAAGNEVGGVASAICAPEVSREDLWTRRRLCPGPQSRYRRVPRRGLRPPVSRAAGQPGRVLSRRSRPRRRNILQDRYRPAPHAQGPAVLSQWRAHILDSVSRQSTS